MACPVQKRSGLLTYPSTSSLQMAPLEGPGLYPNHEGPILGDDRQTTPEGLFSFESTNEEEVLNIPMSLDMF